MKGEIKIFRISEAKLDQFLERVETGQTYYIAVLNGGAEHWQKKIHDLTGAIERLKDFAVEIEAGYRFDDDEGPLLIEWLKKLAERLATETKVLIQMYQGAAETNE